MASADRHLIDVSIYYCTVQTGLDTTCHICSNERSFSVLKFVEKTGCVQQWDRNAWKISLILAVEAEQTQQLDLNHIRELFCVCQPCSRCYSGTWLTDADCCVCSAASAGITRSSRSRVFTFWFTSTCMWPQ